jgi:hypothetical protein
MPAYHVHQWQVRREWWDEDGRRLRHRTCKGCSLEQQVRYVFREMIWTMFRQWDNQNSGPVFDRRGNYVERVIS